MKKESINKRLVNEINKLKESDKLKNFLLEVLMQENANLINYAYKDEYGKLIESSINK